MRCLEALWQGEAWCTCAFAFNTAAGFLSSVSGTMKAGRQRPCHPPGERCPWAIPVARPSGTVTSTPVAGGSPRLQRGS